MGREVKSKSETSATSSFSNIYKCKSYDECDSIMTLSSDFDIAWVRPGKEDSHTAKNIKRRYGLHE